MDFGTIITLLIILGSFIYSIAQNTKEHKKQRPGKGEPFEEESDQEPASPFEDMFPEPHQEQESPEPEPFETQEKPQPRESQQPEPNPFESSEPFKQHDSDYQDPFSERSEEAPRPGEGAYGSESAFERPKEESYQKKKRQGYKRPQKAAYERKKKLAYQKSRHKKSKAQYSEKINQRIKKFDPIMAVIHSDVLNRPKYLDEDIPPPYDMKRY